MSNVTYYARGITEAGDIVKGVLTLLGADYNGIKKGFYIGNLSGAPFAYSVKSDSVVILGNSILDLIEQGHVKV